MILYIHDEYIKKISALFQKLQIPDLLFLLFNTFALGSNNNYLKLL